MKKYDLILIVAVLLFVAIVGLVVKGVGSLSSIDESLMNAEVEYGVTN